MSATNPNEIPFQNDVSQPTTTPFVDKVIQNLDGASPDFGHVDYLHYDGSTLVASYDTTQVNSNFALFQEIVGDYYSDFSQTGDGPITVSTGNQGTATTDLALMTQAEGGGPVDFVYVNDPNLAGGGQGSVGGAGTNILASYQNPVFVPEVHGESYNLPLGSASQISGNASTGDATVHTPDVTLVSQETNGTIDLLGYDITETGPGGAGSGGGVVTLATSDEVGSLANPNVPFHPIGEVVGVADDTIGGTPGGHTYVVAQDTAGHLQFMHLTDVGTPAGGVPHYVVDADTITTETYAPVHDVNPDGPIGSPNFDGVPIWQEGNAPDQLDLVASLNTGGITQIQELYFDVTYNGPGNLTAVTGEGAQGASIVEQNALPPGWEPVDGGIVAAQHFGDVFTV